MENSLLIARILGPIMVVLAVSLLINLKTYQPLIEEFVQQPRSGRKALLTSGNTVRSIFELVREWNTRLAQNGHASARFHSDV